MPRRPPPTSLRLVEGPLPPRGRSKFTLPSVPRPTFQAPAVAPRGPIPRARHPSPAPMNVHMSHDRLPPLVIPTELASSLSVRPSPSSSPKEKITRGPWDHHRSISVQFDLESVLAPPKRAAISTIPSAR
ncbi:hypothetical protein EVG20_g5574 [Dentipellis fragilis]|uniref:Uncharacterized protein n=1 Tax=Dentipellis fragilis TaxID=205917 RepID=A0A4Y9YUT4_9AGAM|nr:hypothetical protein EVG20_g5574 [Dentipellis fragilis]